MSASSTPPTFVALVDVGHGHLTIIWNKESSVVIDTGRNGAVVLAFFRQYVGHRRIRSLILTHLDLDHAGSSKLLLNPSNGFEVDQLVFNPPPDAVASTGFVRALEHEVAKRRSVRPEFTTAEATVDLPDILLGSCVIALHGPTAEFARVAPSKNEQSAVVSVRSGGRVHLVVCGDIGSTGLAGADLTGLRPVEVLLGPHHGGGAADSQDIVNAVEALKAQLVPARIVYAFDSAMSEARPRLDLADSRTTCLQLSKQCHDGSYPATMRQLHLGASAGLRSDRAVPCTGTLVYEISSEGLVTVPDGLFGDHSAFIDLLDSPVCRGN